MGIQSAADIAAELTEGLDDSLQPIDDKAVVVLSDDKKTDVVDEKSDTDDTKDDDKSDDVTDKDSKDDTEGYSIDEIEGNDTEDDKKDNVVIEQPRSADNLTPEQKYIVENLAPIKVQGVIGDSTDLKEYTVYDPSQLPRGFKYTDDRERDIASKSFISMENQALKLQADFRGQENQKAQKAYKEQEEKADWEDIASLQKTKDLPLFKLKPTDKDFDTDPTSVLIDKVLEFKEELNKQYLEGYNNGRPYRHIGFEDAYVKYLKVNPPNAKSDAEVKEDKDRKDLARRTSGANGDLAKSGEKPVILSSKRDIDNYIDNLEF